MGLDQKELKPSYPNSAARLKPSQSFARAASIGEVKYRTKIEREWASNLASQLLSGEILKWRYEPFNLRLSDGIFYRIDFMVTRLDMEIELHEVKGTTKAGKVAHKDPRAALLRYKLAASEFPEFRFFWVTRQAGAWIKKECDR